MDKDNLRVHWHIPTEKELKMADRVLEKFLRPEMESLQGFMAGDGDEWNR